MLQAGSSQLQDIPKPPFRRGCYALSLLGCPKRRSPDFSSWQPIDEGGASKLSCLAFKEQLDEQCGDSGTEMHFSVGEEPKLPTAAGCYAWMPYGCPRQEGILSEGQLARFGRWYPDAKGNISLVACKHRGWEFEHWCNASVQTLWVEADGKMSRHGALEIQDEPSDEGVWMADNSKLRSTEIQGLAFRSSQDNANLNPQSGILWGGNATGRVTADGKWLHVTGKGYLPLELNGTKVLSWVGNVEHKRESQSGGVLETSVREATPWGADGDPTEASEQEEEDSTGCHNAQPGDACFREVNWARNVGIREHPEWYPALSASSSFEDFQAFVHSLGKANCSTPCA